ncbi:MAG: hypothetical protein JWM74_5456 [Myxococcaceae bacterium]|nr:hypothetical protein [Myxococcaceae bacterium]
MKRSLVVQSLCTVATAAVVLCASRDASAIELGTPASEHPFRSAQNFALEIRLSPYRPQIDDDPALNGNKPFEKNFGTAPRFFIGLELDWQVLRIPHVGTLGPGLGVGSVSMSRNVQTATGRASGDETSLTIYPFWGVAVLRADAFWRDLGVPLVPYAKAGLGVGLWRASGSGGTSSQDNVSGKGTTWGTQAALGIALALDAIDPGASRNMDNATGINNTYFFLEAYWLTLDGLGQKNPLHVGTNTWSAGLAFEF